MNVDERFREVYTQMAPVAATIRAYLAVNRIVSNRANFATDCFISGTHDEDGQDTTSHIETMKICLGDCVEEVISYIQSVHGIYSCSRSDVGFERAMIHIKQVALSFALFTNRVGNSISKDVCLQKMQAAQIANSKVTGLGFGIISNSIASHIIYQIQNEAKIRKQQAEAEAYLQSTYSSIEASANRQLAASQSQYFNSRYIPAMKQAINDACQEILATAMVFLWMHQKIDLEVVKNMDFDKSQEILARLSLTESKDAALAAALCSCPYNVNVYVAAHKYNMWSPYLEACAEQIGITSQVTREIGIVLGEAQRKSMYQINSNIANLLYDIEIDFDDNVWKTSAANLVKQSEELAQQNPDSFMAHGALAVFKLAAEADNMEPQTWKSIEIHFERFLELYFSMEEGYGLATWNGYQTIVQKLREHIDAYLDYSIRVGIGWQDEWERYSIPYRWKIGEKSRRRILPAVHLYHHLVTTLEQQQQSGYEVINSDLSSEKFAKYYCLSDVRSDMLWVLSIFNSACIDVRSKSVMNPQTGETKREYYTVHMHLPLKERLRALQLYDKLISMPESETNGGLYYLKARLASDKGDSTRKNIFRSEICDEGLRYFGLIQSAPLKVDTSVSNNSALRVGTRKMNEAKSGCYIATCLYGSYDCPQVWTLRRYRDKVLSKTCIGRTFIRCYYKCSPTIVKLFGNAKWFHCLGKWWLGRFVAVLNQNGIADTTYKDKDW